MGKPVPVYLTVDIILICDHKDILLIRRKNDPFRYKWALPGGFVDPGENLEDAARRELEEETGVDVPLEMLMQTGAFGEPDRDPRGRTVSVTYCVQLSDKPAVLAGSDAGDASWFSLNNLPELAFDHAEIIDHTLKFLNSHEN
jgi:8-oxo-dGTP diphosphatase